MGTGRSQAPVKREIDFDGTFQVKLASILRLFLPPNADVDRITISRLIVLVYLVAGLAVEQEGYIKIEATGHKLEIANVDQNLKRAGLR